MSRILVADDSPVERRLIGALLGRHIPNVEVTYAVDGAKALEEITRKSFDVILTDYQMPIVDGLQLVEQAVALNPGLPIVVITGHGSETTAVRALEVGASTYLRKQEIDSRLIDTVTSLLALSQSRNNRRRLLSSMASQDVSFVLENDVGLITPLISWIQEQLGIMQLADDNLVLRIGVALHESLTNAIYHGNLELDSELRQEDEAIFHDLAEVRRMQEPWSSRRVYVQATTTREMIRYVIRDDGAGYDTKKIADCTDEENLGRVGGRGLLLIRSFMDEVLHNESGNELTMIRYLKTGMGSKSEQRDLKKMSIV